TRQLPHIYLIFPYTTLFRSLIFADNIEDNKEEIRKQLAMLVDALGDAKMVSYPVYDRTVLEAARIELIRIVTLGFTGFDVPASGDRKSTRLNSSHVKISYAV